MKKEITVGAGERDLVISGLEEGMITAYHSVRETFNQKKLPNLRTAAFVVSLDRIAANYIELGLFP